MENKEQQILAEIRTMMASLRQQMETLDAKMAQLQQLTQSDDEELTPIVLDIDTFAEPVEVSTVESVEVPVEEPTEEPTEEPVEEPANDVVEEPAEDLPSDDLPFDLPVEDLPMELVAEEVEEVAEEPVAEVVEEPQPEPVAEQVEEKKPVVQEAIIDVMTEKQAWRTAMPGTPVKDVRLAISLHERVLFINHLFSEDPMAFQAAVNKVNASESLEQVVEYVKETYPQWNLESDLVYRFMMAVRRKIR